MKETVTLSTFRDAFRAIRPNNFSYEGLEVLFDYLTEYEASSGEEMELDVIAICCDYTESTLAELEAEFNREFEDLQEAIEEMPYYNVVGIAYCDNGPTLVHSVS